MIRSIKCLLVVVLCTLSSVPMLSQVNEEALAASLQQKRYSEVIEGLEAYRSEGYESAQMYHQLSEAYWHTGSLGKAILYTLRGLDLQPQHRDMQHNLKWLRSQQLDKLEPTPVFFMYQWWTYLSGWMSATGWAVLGLVWLWLGASLLGIHGLSRSSAWWKKWVGPVGVGFILLAFLPFAWAATRQYVQEQTAQAVVVVKQAALKVAPAEDSATEREVHDGLEVKIVDLADRWYKVSLANGSRGWLPAEAIALVYAPSGAAQYTPESKEKR